MEIKDWQKPKKPTEPEGDLALEMADVLFVIISMANSLNINLEDAITRMMEKYRLRDSNRWTMKQDVSSVERAKDGIAIRPMKQDVSSVEPIR